MFVKKIVGFVYVWTSRHPSPYQCTVGLMMLAVVEALMCAVC